MDIDKNDISEGCCAVNVFNGRGTSIGRHYVEVKKGKVIKCLDIKS